MGKHKYVKEMCNVRNIAIHSEEEGAENYGDGIIRRRNNLRRWK